MRKFFSHVITSYKHAGMTMELREKLTDIDPALREILLTFAEGACAVTKLFHTANRQQAGTINASGEQQLALDIQADQLFFTLFQEKNLIKEYASEERDTVVPINSSTAYSVTLDPLDGSSLLDVNLSVGTILGIWKGTVMQGTLVAAAYVVYGPTTILVFSAGDGVHECLLQDGHCLVLQEHITLKEKGSIYSTGGLRKDWPLAHTTFIVALEDAGYKLRYSGGLVPDVHHILLKCGGLFTYPALAEAPEGKLRLFFELCPFAFLAEQAGGAATDGKQHILEVPRTMLHQRSPIYLGSKKEVEAAKNYLGELL